MKHFKNSQQINYSTDHGSSYADRESFFLHIGLFISPSGISKIDCATTKTDTAERSISMDRESLQIFVQPYSFSLARVVDFWGLPTNASRTGSTVSADGPGRPLRFAAHRQPLCWNFMYHSRIVLSVGGSVWYLIRNLRCTVTIDSVLANSKTQNAFLFTVNAIFRHDYRLAVEPASTPRPLVQKKTWRDSRSIDMLLSAVSVLVVTQSSSEIPEGLMNNPVYKHMFITYNYF